MEKSVLFVMRGHFDVETSCSNVGAGLFFFLNGDLNQYAADAAFMEVIHQEPVSQNLIWMDGVLC